MPHQSWKTYLSDIERFFAVTRMSGFALSPRDINQIREWYLKGIPLTRILKGIAEGVRAFQFKSSPQQRPPHHLGYYAPFVLGMGSTRESSPAALSSKGAEPRRPRVPLQASLEQQAIDLLEQLVAEFDLLQLQEERLLERDIKGLFKDGLVALRQSKDLALLQEDALLERLWNLDEALLALYHSRLDEATRTRLEEAVTATSDDRQMGKQAVMAVREKNRRSTLRRFLNIPDWVG